jgi:branched-chain amino acid transport system permease protein
LTGDLNGAIELTRKAIEAASPRNPEAIAWAYTRLGAYELQRGDAGQAMRAVAQDMQGASMVGINVNQIFSYAFGLSVVLAGTAGILLAPIYLISPLGGWPPFLKAFVIVVFGGLGSTRGVFYSAFILAIIESFVIFEIGATWTMPVWLLTLLVVLIVRPQGLLGVRTD